MVLFCFPVGFVVKVYSMEALIACRLSILRRMGMGWEFYFHVNWHVCNGAIFTCLFSSFTHCNIFLVPFLSLPYVSFALFYGTFQVSLRTSVYGFLFTCVALMTVF